MGLSKKLFPSNNTLKSFTSTLGTKYFEKEVLSSSFSNDETNNLLPLVDVGTINNLNC